MPQKKKKVLIVVFIELLIALLFLVGADWTNTKIFILYHSYFADIFIPFGYYFLLTINSDNKYLNKWWKRSLAVILLCATSETLQFFGIYALARVFDPVDYLAYATGALLAAFLDRKIFNKLIIKFDLRNLRKQP